MTARPDDEADGMVPAAVAVVLVLLAAGLGLTFVIFMTAMRCGERGGC